MASVDLVAARSVSIVIPTRDRPMQLAEALASITAQSHPPAQVVVVDDHSETPVVLDAHPSIEVLVVRHARNQGPGAARNTGMAHATGQLVLFLDDDDLLTPDRLEIGVAAIGDHRMHASATTPPGTRRFEGDMRDTLNLADPPLTGQVLFRREDLLQFDPTLRVGEDIEWWIRMTDRCDFAWSDEVGLIRREHGAARPGVDPLVRARCRTEVAMRHRSRLPRGQRAHHLNRASSANLLAGRRRQAARYAVAALVDRPNVLSLKLVARSLAPGQAFRV